MHVQEDNEPYDQINVVPMLDLAYVLLVIFIIMTTASVQGIKVNLPKASDTPSLAKPKTKAITITDGGQVYLDTYPVTMDELRTQLAAAKAGTPDLPVVVKGDTVVQYGKVMEVLDLLGQVGITQMGLVTQKPAK
jgi:biopolymer transport protein ExbD